MDYYNKVLLPMAKKYVEPTKKYADCVLNGAVSAGRLKVEFISALRDHNIIV